MKEKGMEHKVGDKLLCKYDHTRNNGYIFKRGKYYVIEDEFIITDINFVLIEDCLYTSTGNFEKLMLYDCFCTPADERKMKLNKINGL